MPKSKEKDIYRQSCDLPHAGKRAGYATPHVPYVRPKKEMLQPAAEPVVKEAAPIVPPDPKRVRRNFHLRIAATGLLSLTYLAFTHLK